MYQRFILAPDSFKGTLSAREICDIQTSAILARIPGAQVHALPMADGGEGMTESYLSILGGEKVRLTVTGPSGKPVEAAYGILPDGTAVMEMAAAAGLPLMGDARDPLQATTYGVGEMLLHGAKRGVKRVLLGLGGSATNDCGVGMAAALGYRFVDGAGKPVAPYAKNLMNIARILPPKELPQLEVLAACDVNNPLCGPEGATYTFGPQKGVTDALLPLLDEALAHMAKIMAADLGKNVALLPGAGAAGGLGAAVVGYLQGELKAGVELLLDAAGFDHMLKTADVVFTGEGRIDWQSAHGKVPMGVGLRCKKAGVPCIALCGSIGKGAEAVYTCGINAFFSAVAGAADMESIARTCKEDMKTLTDSVLRLLEL